MSLCTHDSDCPAPLACYTNTTWANTLINTTNKGCLGSGWYGNLDANGNFVDVYQTPTNRWWVSCGILFSMGFLFLMCMSIMNLLRLARAKLIDFDSASTITMQLVVTCALLASSQIVWVLSAVRLDLQTEIDPTSLDRETTLLLPGYVLLIMGLLGVLLSASTISLLWIEVATRASKMDLTKVKNMTLFRRFLIAFELSAMIILLVPVILGKQVISPFTAVVVEVILASFYVVGMIRMTRIIQSGLSLAHHNTAAAARYNQTLREIRSVAFTVCSSLAINIILGIIVSILDSSTGGWKQQTPPGPQVPPVLVMYQSNPAASFVIVAALTLYLTRIVTRRISKNASGSGTPAPSSVSEGRTGTGGGLPGTKSDNVSMVVSPTAAATTPSFAVTSSGAPAYLSDGA